jgi:hypothetical protein
VNARVCAFWSLVLTSSAWPRSFAWAGGRLSASAKELIAAIGFEPRYDDAARHLNPLQHLSRLRIDAPQIALVGFPGTVPQLAIETTDIVEGARGAGTEPGRLSHCAASRASRSLRQRQQGVKTTQVLPHVKLRHYSFARARARVMGS